jgi:hypothetical protein
VNQERMQGVLFYEQKTSGRKSRDTVPVNSLVSLKMLAKRKASVSLTAIEKGT